MVNTDDTRSLGTALAVAVLASAGLMGIYYYGGVAGHADSTPLRAAVVGTAGAALAAALVWRFARGVYGERTRRPAGAADGAAGRDRRGFARRLLDRDHGAGLRGRGGGGAQGRGRGAAAARLRVLSASP